MLFPPEQLQLILQLTNNELAMARKNSTTAGEIVKLFGELLLVTRLNLDLGHHFGATHPPTNISLLHCLA